MLLLVKMNNSSGFERVVSLLKKAGIECSATEAGHCCSNAVKSMGNSIVHCVGEELRPLVPVVCIMGLTIPILWLSHLYLEHADLEPEVQIWRCLICPLSFPTEQEFIKHNILIHEQIHDDKQIDNDAFPLDLPVDLDNVGDQDLGDASGLEEEEGVGPFNFSVFDPSFIVDSLSV